MTDNSLVIKVFVSQPRGHWFEIYQGKGHVSTNDTRTGWLKESEHDIASSKLNKIKISVILFNLKVIT